MITYIIRLKDNSISTELAKLTKESCDKLNIESHYFDAFKGKLGGRYLKDKNIQSSSLVDDKEWTDGTLGCLASHYYLWESCVALNEPFLILEHDAVVIRNPIDIVKDVSYACHLDKFSPFNSKNDSIEHHKKYVEKSFNMFKDGVSDYPEHSFYGDQSVTKTCFRGAHGYIITPSGAKKVINFIEKNGAFPADMCLCAGAMPIQQSNGTYVKLNNFFDTLEKHRRFSTRKNENLYCF